MKDTNADRQEIGRIVNSILGKTKVPTNHRMRIKLDSALIFYNQLLSCRPSLQKIGSIN
jgi:hypothetical protein